MAQNKRQMQKEATREHILRTAMRMFAADGFSAPTSAVAQEAGVSHGTIFVHFPTREDLQLCVLDRFTGEIGARLHQLSQADSGMTELLYAHLNVLTEYEDFYKWLISALNTLSVETRNKVIVMQSAASQHFAAGIARGVKEGRYKELPLHMLFNTWLGLIHYYLLNSELFAPEGSVLERYKDELVNCFMALIRKD